MHPALIFVLVLGVGGALGLWFGRPFSVAAANSPAPSPDDPANADPAPLLVDAPSAVFSAGAAVLENFGAEVKKLFSLPASAGPYADAIRSVEVKNSLPPGLLGRVLFQESRFRPEIINGTVKSPAGALGIAQFMPATARDLGIDPLDPAQAIPAAGAYLKKLFDLTGSWANAVASYNWGVGNVIRKGIAAAPAETQKYVADVSADVNLGA